MNKPAKPIIVVDASITTAASDAPKPDRRGSVCREVLEAIRTICFRAHYSAELQTEWKEHRSKWSRQWRYSMHGMRKIDLDSQEVSKELRDAIETYAESDKHRSILEKDAMLVDAAVRTDCRILSLDEEARKAFSKLAQNYRPIGQVCWVNPEATTELERAVGVMQWLESGAPLDEGRLLRTQTDKG